MSLFALGINHQTAPAALRERVAFNDDAVAPALAGLHALPQVREVARQMSLPVADKPAAPCLASRIPFGQEVTPEKLRQIDDLEDAVYEQGFSDCRVRHHGAVGRIELPTDELPRAMEPAIREALVAAGKEAGFRHVTIDLDGIRSGLFSLQIVGKNARG